MFYSQHILTKKGKLGIIWLAATYKGPRSKYLSSKDFKKVNIIKACEYIMHPSLPFALRLSSTLMVGVVRVYREQTRIILIEANEMVKAVRSAIAEKRLSQELQMPSPEQKRDTVTLPLLLDYEMDFPECQEQIYTDHLIAFAKSDKYFRLPFVKSPQLPLPSPASTPEQKISTEEERSPFQADLKDITIPEIDFSKALGDSIIQVPEEVDIGESLPYDDVEVLRKAPETTPQKIGRSPLELAEEGVVPEEAEVMLFDEKTGDLRPEATPTRETTEVPGPFETPQAGIGELEPVSPPRKRKRRLAIDFSIKLSGNNMRKNLNNVDLLKKKKIYAIPRKPAAAELFSTPSTSVVSEAHFIHHWKANAFVRPLKSDEIRWTIDVPTGLETSPVASAREELSGLEESPVSGIEILRAQSREMSSEFEQSAGIDETPDLSSLDKSRRSRDLSLSGEKRDDSTTPARLVSRPPTVGRTSVLSPIIDEELEVEMLPLEEIEEPISTEDEEITTEKRDEKTLKTLSKIKQAMGDMSEVWLHDFLPLNTPRKQAARAFYHLMALTKSGIIIPVQRAPYEEILIKRGRAY